MAAAVLEHVNRADEIVLDELAAGGVPVDAGEHARIRRRVDDHVDWWQPLEIRCEADVGVMERDAKRTQHRAVLLAAGPNEIVETDDLDACPPRPNGESVWTRRTRRRP